MQFRNTFNFAVSASIISLFLTSVPSLYRVFAVFSILVVGFKAALCLMRFTRKYLLWEAVSPKNKAVLITGCDSGFGNALARKLDKLGYTVFATCLDPNGEGAKILLKDCSENLKVLSMNVTDDQSIQQAKEYVENNLGQNVLWSVVNNAGILHFGEIDWTPVDEIQKLYDVNTAGVFRVTKCFLPLLKKSKGRIVNVTSKAGRFCLLGCVGYCMSKSAAIALTTGLRIELAKWGVNAISIEPYFYATPLTNTQVVTANTKKTWSSAPKEIIEEYGEGYFESVQKVIKDAKCFLGSNINEVIDCLEDAVTAKEPLSTYSPGTWMLRLFSEICPSSIIEFSQQTMLNMSEKPLALRSNENRKRMH